jgi:hypothetical protein
VETRIDIRRTGGKDGYRSDLPLDREMDAVIVDASALAECHPMLALRLRIFVDWHVAAGHSVRLIAPSSKRAAQQLANFDLARGWSPGVMGLPDPQDARYEQVMPIACFRDHTEVEDIARNAVDLLHRQTDPFGAWGDAIYMAIGELCDNALQHGRNELGAYIVADRTLAPRRELRLAIVDLGIGIPEHIRSRYPEWHDDTGAIARAIARGVSGTGDPHRGNGFAEVFDAALQTDLVRASSGADIDIRSGKGHLGVKIFGASEIPEPRAVDQARRGTWITYTVTTA